MTIQSFLNLLNLSKELEVMPPTKMGKISWLDRNIRLSLKKIFKVSVLLLNANFGATQSTVAFVTPSGETLLIYTSLVSASFTYI